MLTVDDYGAIRRARRDGKSIRQIAREFGHGSNAGHSSGVAQGQRSLNRCSGRDFQHEVFAPTGTVPNRPSADLTLCAAKRPKLRRSCPETSTLLPAENVGKGESHGPRSVKP